MNGRNARLARQAGDTDGDQYWTALDTETDEMIWQARARRVRLLPARSRLHPHRLPQHQSQRRETGQWHEADLAVVLWLQRTSRDGDTGPPCCVRTFTTLSWLTS
jgi:hypothetical protein